MTLEEYWKGDSAYKKFVREAHLLKRKQANYDAWLNGFYVYKALENVSPLFRDLLKDHTPEKYIERPLDLYDTEDERKVKEEKQKETNYEQAQAFVHAWMVKANHIMETKEQKKGEQNNV